MGRAFAFVKSGPVDRGCFEHFRESISPAWVEAALLLTGTATVRRRRLPAEQVLWLVVGMALFRNLSIAEVVRELELAGPGEIGVVPAPRRKRASGSDRSRCAGSSSGVAAPGLTPAQTS